MACNKFVRCEAPRQVNPQYAMADAFEIRFVSCCERWKDACGHLSVEDFAAHVNTTAGTKDLAQYENTEAVTGAHGCRILERDGNPFTGSRPGLPTMMLPNEHNPGEC